MRYWLFGFLTVLAGWANAEDSAESWDGWDELPEDVLELSGEDSVTALSERLDSLIQQGNAPAGELDRLLEAWLRQATMAGGAQAVPLQSLIDQEPPGFNGPPRERRDMLDQLLQDLPVNPGNPPSGAGPPSDVPPETNNGNDNIPNSP